MDHGSGSGSVRPVSRTACMGIMYILSYPTTSVHVHAVMYPYHKSIRSRIRKSYASLNTTLSILGVQIDRVRRSNQFEEREDPDFDFGLR